MKPKSFTVDASGGGNSRSPIWRPNIHISPFNVGFGVTVDTTAKFSVLHTFDDLNTVSADAATFHEHEFVVEASARIDGNYAFPMTGVILEVSAASEGAATITFVQAGYAGN